MSGVGLLPYVSLGNPITVLLLLVCFFAFSSIFVSPARMQFHHLQYEASKNMRKILVGFCSNWDRLIRAPTTGFPKKWPSERNRKEHADAVAALAGNGHQVNTTRAANNSVACKNTCCLYLWSHCSMLFLERRVTRNMRRSASFQRPVTAEFHLFSIVSAGEFDTCASS